MIEDELLCVPGVNEFLNDTPMIKYSLLFTLKKCISPQLVTAAEVTELANSLATSLLAFLCL